MRFGCFGDLADYDAINDLGFDSIELGLAEINALTDTQFAEWSRKINNMHCKPHIISRLIPLSERIAEDEFDSGYWLEQFRRGAERTKQWDSTMWVFGAGKPRCLPEEEPARGKVKDKVDSFILKTAELLRRYGILLLIEPLGAPYSNYIGTVEEASGFIKEYRHPNIAAMCDLRHMVNRRESMQNIVACSEIIRHAHIDYPLGDRRVFPKAGDGFDYSDYFAALGQIEYSGLLTVEATCFEDFRREGAESLAFLRRAVKAG